jgi:hypothetical protein
MSSGSGHLTRIVKLTMLVTLTEKIAPFLAEMVVYF